MERPRKTVVLHGSPSGWWLFMERPLVTTVHEPSLGPKIP